MHGYVTVANPSCMPVFIGDREIMLKDKPFELTVNTKQEELIEAMIKSRSRFNQLLLLFIKELKLKSIKVHDCNDHKLFDVTLGFNLELFDAIREDHLYHIKDILNSREVCGNNMVNCIIQVDW